MKTGEQYRLTIGRAIGRLRGLSATELLVIRAALTFQIAQIDAQVAVIDQGRAAREEERRRALSGADKPARCCPGCGADPELEDDCWCEK